MLMSAFPSAQRPILAGALACALAAVLAGCAGRHFGGADAFTPQIADSGSAPANGAVESNRGKTMYVSSRDNAAILGFDPAAKGNTSPMVTIAGSKTHLTEPVGLAIAPSGKIYAANDGADRVLIFPKGAKGNVAPHVLGGSKVPIVNTEGIAADSTGRVYVSDYESKAIYVFAAGATGNTAPIRTIAGDKTGLQIPVGMSFDASGNLYVANANAQNPVEEFAPGADGNVAPIATIGGRHTKLTYVKMVKIDTKGRIVVSNDNSVAVFAAGAHGNVRPKAFISGKATTLKTVTSVGTDAKDDIFVTNLNFKTNVSSVVVFDAHANGNAKPLRVLVGQHTHLNDPFYPTFF
jgi:hypothetical protein